MALKDSIKKFDEGLAKCKVVWEWLRKLPAYRADFKRCKKTPLRPGTLLTGTFHPEEEPMRKRWGFFPLTDPKSSVPGQFIEALALTGEHPHIGCVRLKNARWTIGLKREKNSLVDILGKRHKLTALPPLPEEIIFGVNPKMPLGQLKRELGQRVKNIQCLYQITGKRVRYDTFRELYITHVGRELNWQSSRILKAIRSKVNEGIHANDPTPGDRQKVHRACKKLSA